jgi:hypothetical protein
MNCSAEFKEMQNAAHENVVPATEKKLSQGPELATEMQCQHGKTRTWKKVPSNHSYRSEAVVDIEFRTQ